jgi:hypothetical protein
LSGRSSLILFREIVRATAIGAREHCRKKKVALLPRIQRFFD